MGVAWSLGVEEKFYLLWPMLFVAFAGRWAKLFKCCLAGVGLVWLNKLVLMHVVHAPSLYFECAFDTRVDVILVGCALALATRLTESAGVVCRRCEPTLVDAANDRASDRNRRGCFAQGPLRRPGLLHLRDRRRRSFCCPILFVQLISWSHVPFVRALDSKIARTFGDLSYGIYLYHLPLLWLARRFLQSHVGSAYSCWSSCCSPCWPLIFPVA